MDWDDQNYLRSFRMKFKAETLAVEREQDLVRGMSNQWFILHLECTSQQRIVQRNFARNFQDPRKKKHLCVNQSQKLFLHPGEESLTDQKLSSFAVVWSEVTVVLLKK